MLRKVLFFSLSGLMIPMAQADCTLDLVGDAQVTVPLSPPSIQTISSQVIRINADAPADTSQPIATYNSTQSTVYTSYRNCYSGEMYGKRPIGLTRQDSATKIYSTNIPGIGVKLLWTPDGSRFGNFPSDNTMKFDGYEQAQRFTFSPGSSYRIEFYKTAEKLQLNNKAGVTVIPAGDLAYTWMNIPDPKNFAVKLNVGRITLVSTPACTADGSKAIDFGTVTAAMLAKSPVERALDFQLTCKTDYGSYSTTATIKSPTATSDGKYIQVTDAAKQKEQLGIEILDSSGQTVLVNGESKITPASVRSETSTTFNWKAKLFSTGKGAGQPRGGPFNARAEILLQVN